MKRKFEAISIKVHRKKLKKDRLYFNIKVLFSREAATSVQIQGIHKYTVTIYYHWKCCSFRENFIRKTKILKIAFKKDLNSFNRDERYKL